ncbi:MAG: hypothetical protein RLO08_01855 [Parvibaculaceae bacterium]
MGSPRRVLVLKLTPFADLEEKARLRSWISRETASGGDVTLLVTSASRVDFQGLEAAIWPDGAPRGLLRLLALMRRISWGAFDLVLDAEGSHRTRAYRPFVRPCPPWHSWNGLSVCKDKAS